MLICPGRFDFCKHHSRLYTAWASGNPFATESVLQLTSVKAVLRGTAFKVPGERLSAGRPGLRRHRRDKLREELEMFVLLQAFAKAVP
jgi:hypothetical protein